MPTLGTARRRITTCLAIASALVMISAGPGNAATFRVNGAEFGYSQTFPNSHNSEGNGALRDTSADDHCAWLQVSWDKEGAENPTSTHVVCGDGNSANVALTQHSTFHNLLSMTLRLCRIQRGTLSGCLEQRLDNPNN
jgi:hypothetical protein